MNSNEHDYALNYFRTLFTNIYLAVGLGNVDKVIKKFSSDTSHAGIDYVYVKYHNSVPFCIKGILNKMEQKKYIRQAIDELSGEVYISVMSDYIPDCSKAFTDVRIITKN